MRIPDLLCLFFQVGDSEMRAILVDGVGEVFEPRGFRVSEGMLRELHEAYFEVIPNPDLLARGIGLEKSARLLKELLSTYALFLGAVLEEFVPLIEGKHLKVFPKMQISGVPIHAIPVAGKTLIDFCDVSYAQSLPLFLRLHSEEVYDPSSLAMVWGARAPLYEGLVSELVEIGRQGLSILEQPSLDDIRHTLEAHTFRDLVFGCHCVFDPDNPMDSTLALGNGDVSMFDLARCDGFPGQMAILGSCESSVGRASISSEFLGLPNVFLSAGTRYVVGSLWRVNQLATVVLLSQFFRLLSSGRAPTAALNHAQRLLKAMKTEQVLDWLRTRVPTHAVSLEPRVIAMGPEPFADPRHWAGFVIQGDI